MGIIEGERSVEIAAPISRCYAIAADIDHAPEWLRSMQEVDVLERDDQGRALVVEMINDARVKMVRNTLRFAYEEPTGVTWEQTKGDLKSLHGWWRLEELGPERTRATYGLRADTGRMLGLLLRGPVEGQVREFLLGNAADGLRERAEAAVPRS